MPPKAVKTQIIIKVKRQASIYFITVLPNDTISTVKAKIVDIVNKSGGLILKDELKPITEGGIRAPDAPMIGGIDDSSSDAEQEGAEDDGYDTDDTAPMVFTNTKQISIDEIELGYSEANGDGIIDIKTEDSTKVSNLKWIVDFATIVFKLKNEDFKLFYNEYGKDV